MSKETELRKLRSHKKPTTKKNYVGVEIEFLMADKDIKAFNEAIVEADLANHVNVGTDSSVEDVYWENKYGKYKMNGFDRVLINKDEEPIGREVRVLVTEEDSAEVLLLVCEIIKECGGYVNDTAGLHVHLDMRQRPAKRVYDNLYHLQDLMFATQPARRQNSEYCERVDEDMYDTGHYSSINYGGAYSEHGTIEVRLHEGTINAKEVVLWVEFLKHVANMPNTLYSPVKRFSEIGLDASVRSYLYGRTKKFA